MKMKKPLYKRADTTYLSAQRYRDLSEKIEELEIRLNNLEASTKNNSIDITRILRKIKEIEEKTFYLIVKK